LGHVPGCGRRGEAHRGRGHGGAPTATGKRARAAMVSGGGALACAQRGGGERGVCWCANEGGGEGEWASGLKWPGRGGCELHARRGRGDRGNAQLGRRLRGDDGADSPGPRAEREGKAGAGAEKAAALTGGPAGAEREEGEEARARDWAGWAERPRGPGLWASFPFSFILAFVFSFLFIYYI
jgi:hypothetical protein